MRVILLILLILLLVGALPTWPYSGGWGVLPERRPWTSAFGAHNPCGYRRHLKASSCRRRRSAPNRIGHIAKRALMTLGDETSNGWREAN